MRTLNLSLNKKWFDLHHTGHKDEDYREIKPYWIKRLIVRNQEMERDVWDQFCEDLKNPPQSHRTIEEILMDYDCDFKDFDCVQFINGYSLFSPRVIKEFLGMDIGIGTEILGAPVYPVFIIKVGKILSF